MIPKHPKARVILLTVSLGLLSLAAGFSLWRIHEARKWSSLESLILLPEPRSLSDFALSDQHGKPFTLDGFRGHWSLVFFGYTFCPDVCPNTLFQLQQARKLMLQQESAAEIPVIYFISVDPERDTTQKLSDYLSYFDPEFVGLRGADPQLKALTLQLGIAYFIEPHAEGAAQYQVDHSASLLLLNPAAQLVGVIPARYDASSIAHDVMTVVSQEGSAP